MSINGSVPAHAFYGRPVDGYRPAGQTAGSRLATASGPYLGRGNKCTAKEDTCEGNRVAGEMLCAGHLRSYNKAMDKAIKAEEAAEIQDGG
jgi:hypothetical protein